MHSSRFLNAMLMIVRCYKQYSLFKNHNSECALAKQPLSDVLALTASLAPAYITPVPTTQLIDLHLHDHGVGHDYLALHTNSRILLQR